MSATSQVTLQESSTSLANEAPIELSRLAVIVPCCNETESLESLAVGLDRLRQRLAASAQLELVLVDDGSTDNTWEELHRRFSSLPHTKFVRHGVNRGIASAIASGMASTDAALVASLDADGSYDPTLVAAMFELLVDGVDMVVASPYHPAGGVVGVPRWRLQLSRVASRLYGGVMRNKLHTYTSCVRVYRREAVTALRLRNPGFVGIVELAWALDVAGGTIVEHPATLSVREFGQSKMKVTRTTLAHLRFLARAVGGRLTRRNRPVAS